MLYEVITITSICHYYGGSMIRGAFAHEPARLEVILLGMQGLGKPGVHQAQFTYKGMPRSKDLKERGVYNPALPDRLNKPNVHTAKLFTKQFIPKTLVQQAITSPPVITSYSIHYTKLYDVPRRYPVH